MTESNDPEDSTPVEVPGTTDSAPEKEPLSPYPSWYEQTIVVVAAIAVAIILVGIGVFEFMSASTASSAEGEALETLAGLDDRLARLQTDTRAVRTEIDAEEAATASTRQAIAASDADTSTFEAAIGDAEDPIRELQSEVWELYGAVQRVADLENSISDGLDDAVGAGSRREIDNMTSIASSLESGQLADLESAVGQMEALLLATDSEFEVNEDFERPVGEWEIDASGNWGVADGGYVVTASDNGFITWAISPYQIANVAIEVTALPVEGADDGVFAYGVLCRAEQDPVLTGYWFQIGGDGIYQVGWFSPSGDFVYLLGLGQTGEAAGASSAINRGLEENRVTVVCDGPDLSLAVNGLSVWEGTDDNLTNGNVALGAITYGDKPVTVHFDDLRLTGVTDREGG